MKNTTYILTANSSEAHIYSLNQDKAIIDELVCFRCPESKLHNVDLVSDKPGRVAQQSGRRTKGLSVSETPKARAIKMFAKSLSAFLDDARKRNQFNDLILAASPKFLGILHKEMDGKTSKIVSRNINKDLSHLSGKSVLRLLKSDDIH